MVTLEIVLLIFSKEIENQILIPIFFNLMMLTFDILNLGN